MTRVPPGRGSPDAETPAGGEARSATGPKILVVQNHPGLRKTLTECLAGKGCSVVPANGGVKGLLEFMREQPQIVIIDVHIEDMHALQLLAEIRERAMTPVVLITDKMAPILSAVEGVAVLRKPFSPTQLMQKIREALGAGSPRRERVS